MSTNGAVAAAAADESVMVVDMGKQAKSRIKKLRKGKGKLMDRVNDAIAELRASGSADGVSTFVVVVKEKMDNPIRKMLG
jgi:hypothetical protein